MDAIPEPTESELATIPDGVLFGLWDPLEVLERDVAQQGDQLHILHVLIRDLERRVAAAVPGFPSESAPA